MPLCSVYQEISVLFILSEHIAEIIKNISMKKHLRNYKIQEKSHPIWKIAWILKPSLQVFFPITIIQWSFLIIW